MQENVDVICKPKELRKEMSFDLTCQGLSIKDVGGCQVSSISTELVDVLQGNVLLFNVKDCT